MSGPGLPVNVDASYADDGADASVKVHQQHHDTIHALLNLFDTGAGAAGDAHIKDGTTGLFTPTAVQRPAYTGTFAGMPLASAYPGRLALATDINGGTLYASNGTTWLQGAPGVTSQGGTLLGSAELTTSYSIFSNGTPTTFTDVGMSVVVGSVQPLAYIVELTGHLVATGGATWAAGSMLTVFLRLIDSAGTKIGASTQVKFRGEGTAGQQYIVPLGTARFRVPASHAATTWKVQGKLGAAAPTGVTEAAVFVAPAFEAPLTTYQTGPALLTATTVG